MDYSIVNNGTTCDGCGLRECRPHLLHAVQRCGLLLQMSHVTWSLCLCVSWHTGLLCKKRLNRSRCCFGSDSC